MSKYYSDPSVRKRIDSLLEINARIQSNLGTRGAYDVGSTSIADQMWIQFLIEIRQLDAEFYSSVATSEEKEMVSKKIYNKYRFRQERSEPV